MTRAPRGVGRRRARGDRYRRDVEWRGAPFDPKSAGTGEKDAGIDPKSAGTGEKDASLPEKSASTGDHGVSIESRGTGVDESLASYP